MLRKHRSGSEPTVPFRGWENTQFASCRRIVNQSGLASQYEPVRGLPSSLVQELEAQNWLTQHDVIASLGRIGPRAKSAASELRRILELPFPKDREDFTEVECYSKVLAGWALKRISD
jgi:hypothetical protein